MLMAIDFFFLTTLKTERTSAFFVKEYFPVPACPHLAFWLITKLKCAIIQWKKWYKRLLRTIRISEQWTLLCEQKKLLTSRQIFRYAVPARTVTKSTATDPSHSDDRFNAEHFAASCVGLKIFCIGYWLFWLFAISYRPICDCRLTNKPIITDSPSTNPCIPHNETNRLLWSLVVAIKCVYSEQVRPLLSPTLHIDNVIY